MSEFTVAKRGDYQYPAIYCRKCGVEVKRSGKRGRPMTMCAECRQPKQIAARAVEFAVNVNEQNEPANFVKVDGDEFWQAMAAKALLRRSEIPAPDSQQ